MKKFILESLIPRPVYKPNKQDGLITSRNQQLKIPIKINRRTSEESFIERVTRFDSRLGRDLVKIGIFDYINKGVMIPFNIRKTYAFTTSLKISLLVFLLLSLVLTPKLLIISGIVSILMFFYVRYMIYKLYSTPIHILQKYAPSIFITRWNRITKKSWIYDLADKIFGRAPIQRRRR